MLLTDNHSLAITTLLLVFTSGCVTYERTPEPDVSWISSDGREITQERTKLSNCNKAFLTGTKCEHLADIEISIDQKGLFAPDRKFKLRIDALYRTREVCVCNDRPVLKLVYNGILFSAREPIGVLEFAPEQGRPSDCDITPFRWGCQGWQVLPAETLSQRRAIDNRLAKCSCHIITNKRTQGPWSGEKVATLRWKYGLPRVRYAPIGKSTPESQRNWTSYYPDQARIQYCYEVALFAKPELQGQPISLLWDFRTASLETLTSTAGAERVKECLREYKWKLDGQVVPKELGSLRNPSDLGVVIEISHGDLP